MRQNANEPLFFFPSAQMTILIRTVLWEDDNGAQAINLKLWGSSFTDIDVNVLTFRSLFCPVYFSPGRDQTTDGTQAEPNGLSGP